MLKMLNTEIIRTELSRIKKLDKNTKHALSKSLLIRHLDTGSCNAEEAELLALSNPIYDLTQFGIDFTASPRHADVLTVSGPVTRHLKIAMEKTYNAMPSPKIVIAIGDGACNGSIYEKSYACLGKVDDFLPVDIYIPGNPPTPSEILNGLLLCKELLNSKKIKKSTVKLKLCLKPNK
jgi:Ni,Fe-hydrogenase III small subunit